MDVLGTALSSLDQAQGRFEQSVNGLIRAASFSAAGDTADLSAAAVALISAKNQVALNLNVVKTAEEMQKSTIDILA